MFLELVMRNIKVELLPAGRQEFRFIGTASGHREPQKKEEDHRCFPSSVALFFLWFPVTCIHFEEIKILSLKN